MFLYNILKWTIYILVRVNSHYKTNYPRKAKALEHNSLGVCQMRDIALSRTIFFCRRLKPPQKTNTYAHRNLHNAWPSSSFNLWPVLSKEIWCIRGVLNLMLKIILAIDLWPVFNFKLPGTNQRSDTECQIATEGGRKPHLSMSSVSLPVLAHIP